MVFFEEIKIGWLLIDEGWLVFYYILANLLGLFVQLLRFLYSQKEESSLLSNKTGVKEYDY